MMRDLTLLMPTHNCAPLLAAVLNYLEAEKADCRILVLDSSDPEVMAANRTRVADSSLDADFAEFVNMILPDEKCRQGIRKVTTSFFALCTDGDVVVLHGLRRCLEALRADPAACSAQGCSFTFLPLPDGDIQLNDILYPITSNDETPLRRLAHSFAQHPTPGYGPFRTSALQNVCDAFQPLTSSALRDLLWSALTAIAGKIIGVPNVSYGCRRRPSVPNSHPLEWFCNDPDGLISEYLRYRELLIAAVAQTQHNEQSPEDVRSALDVIHLRYLLKRAPDAVLKFVAEQQMAGLDVAEYASQQDGHVLPTRAAGVRSLPERDSLDPSQIRGRDRSYNIYPSFYAPPAAGPQPLSDIVRLIGSLDNYRPPRDSALAAEGALIHATVMPRL
jgi:glycosyltransferase domain-containing protein